MSENKPLVTAEDIGNIREKQPAKKALKDAVNIAASEVSLAVGNVGLHATNLTSVELTSAAKEALENLLLTRAAFDILERLDQTVERQNSKPVDKEAVGWALQSVRGTGRHMDNLEELRQALNLEQREYRLSDELKARLFEELEQSKLRENAQAVGAAVS